jgi:hypothetical protein
VHPPRFWRSRTDRPVEGTGRRRDYRPLRLVSLLLQPIDRRRHLTPRTTIVRGLAASWVSGRTLRIKSPASGLGDAMLRRSWQDSLRAACATVLITGGAHCATAQTFDAGTGTTTAEPTDDQSPPPGTPRPGDLGFRFHRPSLQLPILSSHRNRRPRVPAISVLCWRVSGSPSKRRSGRATGARSC